ncbi:hypothetical protein [Candidatus Palauibacter soopunensis]|uniref:hypothetical protein n=1 Tax=Candidatus Palauibacter soopunensis TaxID=3056739 RepID=UPI002389B622|nr:hypothetical protein [Candidatus Palauibacter soopunensis]MDE2878704.1 hypothetical protein [Candidatus Palauibacter soopunensis]
MSNEAELQRERSFQEWGVLDQHRQRGDMLLKSTAVRSLLIHVIGPSLYDDLVVSAYKEAALAASELLVKKWRDGENAASLYRLLREDSHARERELLEEASQAVERVKKWRNQVVAHRDMNPDSVTYGEISDALKNISEKTAMVLNVVGKSTEDSIQDNFVHNALHPIINAALHCADLLRVQRGVYEATRDENGEWDRENTEKMDELLSHNVHQFPFDRERSLNGSRWSPFYSLGHQGSWSLPSVDELNEWSDAIWDRSRRDTGRVEDNVKDVLRIRQEIAG